MTCSKHQIYQVHHLVLNQIHKSVSTLKKYKKWSKENNDLFVDGYILINEQILFVIQRFDVGSFFFNAYNKIAKCKQII